MDDGRTIIDPATMDPTIVHESPAVQGAAAARETRIAEQHAVGLGDGTNVNRPVTQTDVPNKLERG